MLEINDTLTKDGFIKFVIDWNQGSPHPERIVSTVVNYAIAQNVDQPYRGSAVLADRRGVGSIKLGVQSATVHPALYLMVDNPL